MPTTSRVPAVARGRKPRGAFIALRTSARRSVEVAATARTQPLPPAKLPFRRAGKTAEGRRSRSQRGTPATRPSRRLRTLALPATSGTSNKGRRTTRRRCSRPGTPKPSRIRAEVARREDTTARLSSSLRRRNMTVATLRAPARRGTEVLTATGAQARAKSATPATLTQARERSGGCGTTRGIPGGGLCPRRN